MIVLVVLDLGNQAVSGTIVVWLDLHKLGKFGIGASDYEGTLNTNMSSFT